MDSSISHFERFPHRAFLLLMTALVTWVACAFYSVYLNPEVVHYREGYAIQNAWAAQMVREHGAKTVVYGGSSCAFSVDGERMLAHDGEPIVNGGLIAGMGPMILTESALSHLRRGDTLIVAVEPELLTESFKEQTAIAVQYSLASHHLEWVLHPALEMGRVNWFQVAAALRPGGYHTFTLLGKLAQGKPLYRYQLSDYHRSGWMQTAVRLPLTQAAEHGTRLSDDARLLLTNISKWCQTNGIRVAYAFPWSYCPPDQLRRFKKENAEYIAEVMTILPVLRDPSLGADPVAEDFADSPLHPIEAAAARHTDELARELRQWDTWTPETLKQAIAESQ